LRVAPGGIMYIAERPGADSTFSRMSRAMAITIRTVGEPQNAQKAVEAIVHDMDPTLPVFNVLSMSDVVSKSMTELSFTVIVLGVAAAITLALGAVGLYGVIAYMVGMRTREIGVRIALGARPVDVGTLVARQGLGLTAAGLVTGVVLFLALARFLRSLLFEVSPADPLAIGGSMLVLIVVATAACLVPARRASRIDPANALRAD
ncbi:MAG: FtsX-like permease family protein, partial [Gemmatimonadaceae bacterium]